VGQVALNLEQLLAMVVQEVVAVEQIQVLEPERLIKVGMEAEEIRQAAAINQLAVAVVQVNQGRMAMVLLIQLEMEGLV